MRKPTPWPLQTPISLGNCVQQTQHWWRRGHLSNYSAENHWLSWRHQGQMINNSQSLWKASKCLWKKGPTFVAAAAHFTPINTHDPSSPLRRNQNGESVNNRVTIWPGAHTGQQDNTYRSRGRSQYIASLGRAEQAIGYLRTDWGLREMARHVHRAQVAANAENPLDALRGLPYRVTGGELSVTWCAKRSLQF
jgi:hypothetical protein